MGKESNNPWKILSSKIVYESPFLKVREDKVITPEGKTDIHNVTSFGSKSIGGVVVAPVNEQEDVYLIRQYRYAYGDYALELVAGMVVRGDSSLSAAKRELREETGLLAKSWTKIGETFIGTESVKHKSYLFLARQLTACPSNYRGENRMEVFKVPLRDAVKMVISGKIPHASSALTILLADNFLRWGAK